ncbi:DUF4870 domain-containing protein [Shewanella sp. 202IG2-18]|uniref:DUF4870 domain-containing protein n=1 Tax=Parashewanella hymeniacidonis TaxID=2807618 RepID=UPI001961FF34|nr:DUF4870 domain-containing protein [Parashewanella hymeniacidonis]MBM7071996.1 DUF4870 domain-containing protein [Parashewanella hymeniacidonis]
MSEVAASDQESRNLGMLLWIGTIFFGFIPGLILYLIKKDDQYVQEQAKEALNWSITSMIGYAISTVLVFIVVGFLGYMILGIAHLIFCILGAIKASNGEDYRVKYTLRLLK